MDRLTALRTVMMEALERGQALSSKPDRQSDYGNLADVYDKAFTAVRDELASLKPVSFNAEAGYNFLPEGLGGFVGLLAGLGKVREECGHDLKVFCEEHEKFMKEGVKILNVVIGGASLDADLAGLLGPAEGEEAAESVPAARAELEREDPSAAGPTQGMVRDMYEYPVHEMDIHRRPARTEPAAAVRQPGVELRREIGGTVMCIAFSGDGRRVAVGAHDGSVCIINRGTGEFSTIHSPSCGKSGS